MRSEWTSNAFNYYIEEETNPCAHIGFKLINDGKTYVVEHTLVPSEYRGRGLAGKITTDFLQQIRDKGSTVLPLCPFTRSFFEQHPEYNDLLISKNGDEPK
ncbi:GNAT family N-acetyltransferase [Liquorilactobacillus uvarum]|nr:GNAT family N-acetyltransferase [Liquorilactobacillus uvarum]